MSFLMPKMPAMPAIPAPQPLPEPPSYDDKERAEEARLKRARMASKRTGRSSTILTTAKGLGDNQLSTTKKTLLG